VGITDLELDPAPFKIWFLDLVWRIVFFLDAGTGHISKFAS
jgi:hypothetical protein